MNEIEVDDHYSHEDILNFSDEEIERARSHIETKLAHLDWAVEDRKLKKGTKEFDRDWYSRTLYAKKIVGVQHQQITRELARRKVIREDGSFRITQITIDDGVIFGLGDDNHLYFYTDGKWKLFSNWSDVQ